MACGSPPPRHGGRPKTIGDVKRARTSPSVFVKELLSIPGGVIIDWTTAVDAWDDGRSEIGGN